MHQLAWCIDGQGRKDESLDLYRLTLNFEETALGGEHLQTIITRKNLALTLEDTGNDEEAAQHLQILLALKGSYTESSHPRIYQFIVQAEEVLELIERRRSGVEAEYSDDD